MASAKSGISGNMASLSISLICVSIAVFKPNCLLRGCLWPKFATIQGSDKHKFDNLDRTRTGELLIDIASTRPHLNPCVHMSLMTEPLGTTSLCTSLQQCISMLLCLHRSGTCLGRAVAESMGEVWSEAAISSPTSVALAHYGQLVSKLRPLIHEAQLPPGQTSCSVKPSVLYVGYPYSYQEPVPL